MQEFSTITLENGIRCVHRRVRSSVAHIALTINAGTRDESPEQHGVAHLVEHLLFKGTARRTAFQINNRLESVGGELNAFTTKEETVLHASCLVGDFSKGADLLCDMAFNSAFVRREIEKEKQVIIDEINSYKDSPSELIFDEFEERLFENLTLGRNILGTQRQLTKIQRDDLLDFVGRNYNTDQIVFSSSSSLTHNQFRVKCEKYLNDITSNIRKSERCKPESRPAFNIVRNKKTYQTHTVIGGSCYSLYDERRMPFALLINILGGQSSLSRLNQTLRERYAITYNVEASYTPYTDCGVWAIYFGSDADKHQQALELVMAEIEKIKIKLTDNQLKKAKKQFVGQLMVSSENNENFIMAIAKSMLIFNSFDTNEQIAARIEAITAEELQDVAKEIFRGDNINFLTYK